MRDRDAYLLNIYSAQFTKAWEIIREKKMQAGSVAQMSNSEPSANGAQLETTKPSSEGWQSDIVAFETYLGELASKAVVPDKGSLMKRVTLIPGSEETHSEVISVTDGAGGYVDLNPAEDTVQFLVNRALKRQDVKWEFELAHNAASSVSGVTQLIPKTVGKANANSFLATLILHTTEKLELKAGDLVKLEATIGDAAQNNGLGGLAKPLGPVAVYHLDSQSHPVFWLGLTNVKILGPVRKKAALRQPAQDITAFAKDLLHATLAGNENRLNQLYAPEVQLLPGNRLFKFGLEVPGKMSEYGVAVKREEMLVALKKQADRDPIPSFIVGTMVNSFRIEQVDAEVGEYVTEPNQPDESLYQSLRFKIEQNDVLLKFSAPGAFRYVQLRKSNEKWLVIAEF